jgi:hypothetical protein
MLLITSFFAGGKIAEAMLLVSTTRWRSSSLMMESLRWSFLNMFDDFAPSIPSLPPMELCCERLIAILLKETRSWALEDLKRKKKVHF